MAELSFILIYFIYGLAFFSMGLQVAVEGGRSSDLRLRRALRPLAAFGLIHGAHEWFEMFQHITLAYGFDVSGPLVAGVRLSILAFSFISLAAFGGYLLLGEDQQRLALVIPLGLQMIWAFGILILRGFFSGADLMSSAEVWTRYSIAIPGSVLAAVGLVNQQREFRRTGLVQFGRDTLWAALAFLWYGLVGQVVTQRSPLPPSTFLNEVVFLQVLGFPIQLVRAISAFMASLFVIRFLRAFQVEIERQIISLQEARLEESRQREELRGQLFRQVVAAQEAERQRIARDLHDETGQALTAIGLGLRGLSTTIRHGNSDQAISTLRHLEALSANSLTELQRLIADLRPSHLDDLGLDAALRWYSNMVSERTGLDVHVQIAGDEKPVDSAVKIALFRVVQESLNNIIKHANASKVNIHLIYEPTRVHITVTDNGRGFDPQAVNKNQRRVSLGLIGMQERAALLGGTCSIHSQPGHGTVVEVAVPYSFDEKEANGENTPSVGG